MNGKDDKLGQGGFGIVREINGQAVKSFRKLYHMVPEVLMLKYMQNSPYVVKMIDYDFDALTVTMEKWDMNLRTALQTFSFEHEEKMEIIRQICCALSHFQSRRLIHCDIKPSNILFRIRDEKIEICLADLGLSSFDDFGKYSQTAASYRPINATDTSGHDMFGLSIIIVEMLTEKSVKKPTTSSQLRRIARERLSPDIYQVIRRIIPDDLSQSESAAFVLKELFNQREVFPFEILTMRRNKLSSKLDTRIRDDWKSITCSNKINRKRRCHDCVVSFLNRRDQHDNITTTDCTTAITAFSYIFSCLFGTPAFGRQEVRRLLGNRGMDQIVTIIELVLLDDQLIQHMLKP